MSEATKKYNRSGIMFDTYYDYCELSSTNQVLFRDVILAASTYHLLQILNEASDLADSSIFMPALPLVHLIVFIEVYDKDDSQITRFAKIENKLLRDIECPRELIRFIHERNPCNCRGSAVNELKATTQRTNRCLYCQEHKPIKQIKECSGCNAAFNCSRECQLSHYPEQHKENCRMTQELCKDEMSTAQRVLRMCTLIAGVCAI